jgi:hypothetical protein
MRQRLIAILFLLGLVLICSFLTPINFKGSGMNGLHSYDYNYNSYSNIFNKGGQLLLGQFLLYILIWFFFCLGLYFLLKKKG